MPMIMPVRWRGVRRRPDRRQRADVRVALLLLFEHAVGDALRHFLAERVRADEAFVGRRWLGSRIRTGCTARSGCA